MRRAAARATRRAAARAIRRAAACALPPIQHRRWAVHTHRTPPGTRPLPPWRTPPARCTPSGALASSCVGRTCSRRPGPSAPPRCRFLFRTDIRCPSRRGIRCVRRRRIRRSGRARGLPQRSRSRRTRTPDRSSTSARRCQCIAPACRTQGRRRAARVTAAVRQGRRRTKSHQTRRTGREGNLPRCSRARQAHRTGRRSRALLDCPCKPQESTSQGLDAAPAEPEVSAGVATVAGW